MEKSEMIYYSTIPETLNTVDFKNIYSVIR